MDDDLENILYGPRARGELTRETLEFGEFLLAKVGLQEFRDKYPGQLSGGHAAPRRARARDDQQPAR